MAGRQQAQSALGNPSYPRRPSSTCLSAGCRTMVAQIDDPRLAHDQANETDLQLVTMINIDSTDRVGSSKPRQASGPSLALADRACAVPRFGYGVDLHEPSALRLYRVVYSHVGA